MTIPVAFCTSIRFYFCERCSGNDAMGDALELMSEKVAPLRKITLKMTCRFFPRGLKQSNEERDYVKDGRHYKAVFLYNRQTE